MQFSLSFVSILLLAPSAFALVAPRDEVAAFPVEDIIGSDDTAAVVTDGVLEERAQTHCSNKAFIGKDKDKYKGKCQKSKSKGWASGHNCKDKGGKSYLCVQNNKATCYVSIYLLSFCFHILTLCCNRPPPKLRSVLWRTESASTKVLIYSICRLGRYGSGLVEPHTSINTNYRHRVLQKVNLQQLWSRTS